MLGQAESNPLNQICYLLSNQQSLLGNSLGEFCLPTEIRTGVFNEIINLLTSDETELMKKCYKNDSNAGVYYLHTNFR